MDIRFVARNVELADELKEYMERKLSKLEKFFPKILDNQIVLNLSRGIHTVEVTSNVNGVIMRGEERDSDLRKAFDIALKNLERRIRRHKKYLVDRVQLKTHDVSFNIDDILADMSKPSVEEKEEKIVKVKKFPLRPMSAEEACMQMDLLGHSFFIFSNAENGAMNVVYKRKSGGYGLLEPTD
ncbi:ribosome-associated translation inhibitor RaiA [Dethiosulfovibrio sp. F2B]|uniref:ribosome hibernation-promoting factor, HPF/YfiA family n=1 Tax=Dethiosulfovibrio faecalis TaxID=2720018 RepID=UPI001F31860B|nr:ribosome-associated translation inhibitor RaiA [Dethiosulfovibrio faecalis]MCF4150266.1 ribosome-associated translation inhibitor RaiA [Dethiosulfovibrio faecalis]